MIGIKTPHGIGAAEGRAHVVLFVTGGSGSGKSEYAEARCLELGKGPKIYLATMDASDEESLLRIKRHRQQRAGKGFETLECPLYLEQAEVPQTSTVLLECLSTLAANELFAPGGRGEHAGKAILAGLQKLTGRAGHTVIVSNQVFSDGTEYDPWTTAYMQLLAELNRAAAQLADEAVEVVCGIPVQLKKFPDS